MSSNVNVGTFRDPITIYFEDTVTFSDMGSAIQTFISYEVFADVNQIKSSVALAYGLDLMNDNYSVKCRVPDTKRPVKIDYNGASFRVVSSQSDKRGLFLDIIISKNR